MSAASGRLTVGDFEGAGSEWDDFVRTHDGTLCHLWGWRAIVGETMGHRPHYRAAWQDGQLVGVSPLVEVRAAPFGRFLLSMPFLNGGGPIGSPSARTALAQDARRIGEAARVDLVELRGRSSMDTDLVRSDRKITVVRDLPEGSEELWKALGSKLRSQVRRPQKEGMEFCVGADQIEAFYEVFAENMRDLGTPVLPLRFFESIAGHLSDQVVFATVRHEGRPIAGGCGFAYADQFEMTWASSLRAFNRQAPNMLLYWGCMEEMANRGLATFDFGRCTPGSGTHRFKLQWGGRDVALPWYQWSRRGVSTTPDPSRPIFRLATAVWQRLPLTVANRVGPHLARRLP